MKLKTRIRTKLESMISKSSRATTRKDGNTQRNASSNVTPGAIQELSSPKSPSFAALQHRHDSSEVISKSSVLYDGQNRLFSLDSGSSSSSDSDSIHPPTHRTSRREDDERVQGETHILGSSNDENPQSIVCRQRQQPQQQHLNESTATIDNLSCLPPWDGLPVAEAIPETDLHRNASLSMPKVVACIEVVSYCDFKYKRPSNQSPLLRPSMVAVQFYKPTTSNRLGLTLRDRKAYVEILRVSRHGPLADSPLQPGHRLFSLDGRRNWTASEAVKYLKEAVGFVKIVASDPQGGCMVAQAAFYQRSKNLKMAGVSFRHDDYSDDDDDDDDDDDKNTRRIHIHGLDSSCPMGGLPVLNVGDRVESVNGIPCTQLDLDAINQIMNKTSGFVTMTVRKQSSQRIHASKQSSMSFDCTYMSHDIHILSGPKVNCPVHIEASPLENNTPIKRYSQELRKQPYLMSIRIPKSHRENGLGFQLQNAKDGTLQFSKVEHSGMIAKFPQIQPGFTLLSVNGKHTEYWKSEYTERFLRKTKMYGNGVEIVVRNPNGDQDYVQAIACKPNPNASIGVSFRACVSGQIRMGIIRKGIFSSSVLQFDTEVVAINDILCQYMDDATDAIGIVKDSQEIVSILAKITSSKQTIPIGRSLPPLIVRESLVASV